MVFEIESDKIPFRKQYVSITIILINVIVFIIQIFDPTGYMFVYEAAFIPSDFFSGQKLWTIFTAMFMHGNIIHILMNMWFFYVVANNTEAYIGHLLFLITYIISGIAAALLHTSFTVFIPDQMNIPTLGASGAIFGVIAVYGILFPNNRLALFISYVAVNMRAKFFIIIYFVIQLVYGFLLWGVSSTAYFAHVGGFIAGAIIALIFKKLKQDRF